EENENPDIKQPEKYRYSPTEELGEKLPETKIVPMERRPFISKVAKISHSLMGVTVFKDMIGALIRKDYKDFAINTAFLLGGPLIESLSVRMSSLGE
uniref:Uncharacterized protein n=1 Tax=Romanomermis culicivorax TaxID=13658 RepID=A0A915KPS9_ROMCU